MRYVNCAQRTPEWLRWREEGITATESAVILGLSPFKTPWRLWAEKVHRAVPANLDSIPQVRYGREHEDQVRRLFEQAHGEFVSPACAEYDGDPLFRASFDGLTMEDVPVEIKCPGAGTLDDVLARREQSEAYRLYSIQVQHQMLVSGAAFGWLVFYDGRTDSLIEFRIERDQAVIDSILAAGRDFWKLVSSRQEPAMDPKRDVFVPQGAAVTEWAQLAQDYCALEDEAKALSGRIAALKKQQACMKERIGKLMGDHQIAEFAGLRVRRTLKTGAVDYDALLKAKGIDPADKEAFRKAPIESWSFTGTGRNVPEGVVGTPDELALIQAAQDAPDLWI